MGKLIIIGGAEDKGIREDIEKEENNGGVDSYYKNGILHRIVNESVKKQDSRIEILTTASAEPVNSGKDYTDAFERLGATNIGILDIRTRNEAHNAVLLDRLKNADVVMVTGGDQMRLTSNLGGTPFLDLLSKKCAEDDFIYAGSSAGAAAASNNMVFKGESEDALYKGKVRITSGLGLINDVIIDTHFVKRGRIGRLLQAIVANPRLLGIGLEENAALMIDRNKVMTAVGPGMVLLVCGRNIRDSNFNDIDDNEAISIENITLHVMSKYDTYDLKTHKLTIDHDN